MSPKSLYTRDHVLVVTISVGVVMTAHYLLWGRQQRREREAKRPPLAPAGILQTIKQMSGSNYPWFMLRMAKESQSYTFRVNLPIFGTPMVVAVGDVETHRAILTHRATERPIELMYKAFDNVTGGGQTIFTSNGEYWHKRRKLLAPAFEKIHVERMNSVALARTDCWIDTRLRSMVEKGESFDVGREMVTVILSAICETAFEYQITEEDQHSYITDLDLCLKEFLFKSTTNPLRPLLGRLLSERRQAYQASERLMTFARKIMDNFRRLETPVKGTIIDRIMRSDVYESDREREAEIVFLLLAGHDTTGYSIAWTLLELARHPEHLLDVRQSLSEILSPKDWHTSKPLQYAIKEAMRLHPVAAAGSVRVIGEDIETLDGRHFLLPKGSIIFLPLILMMRNPRVFDSPDRFQPTRWEAATQDMKDSFLPFSLGKQNCLGQALAKIEVHSIVARICSEFDLSVAAEGTDDYFLTWKPVEAKLLARRVER